MTQVRIQKLWRGHMTRWTQIMELTTSYDAVPLDITTLCCCVETTLFPLDITTLLWCDSVLKTRKKVRRKREEELIFIGMVSKTSVELISTQWQWQMTKMNINQMLSDFSLKNEHGEQNISRIDINPMTMTNGKNEYQPDVVRFMNINQI